MKLVDSNDLILNQPCEKFNFLKPQVDLTELADNMVRAMYDNYGMGLSANQVGVPLQIFVMAAQQPILVINPRILLDSSEQIELEEGCLTFPGDLVKVKRPIWIKARYHLPNGIAQTFKFEGITARVFQHEYDHIINGKTMFDHMSKLKREMYNKKKLKKAKL
jgi:peptide deformylase